MNPTSRTRVDLWLTFTGVAYGFEAFLLEVDRSNVVLELKSADVGGGEAHLSQQQEFALLQEIVANPAHLKAIEIRVFVEEPKIFLSASSMLGQEFVSLISSRLPIVRRNSRTHVVEVCLSEVLGVSAIEQSNWTRFVDRTFVRSRV